MGITTPFPEPDSPELRRFAVQSRSEVAGLVRALQERAVPLNVYSNATRALGVATLLGVDEKAAALIFESPDEEGAMDRMTAAPALTFVGFMDGIKVQFGTSCAAPETYAGRLAMTVPVPDRVLRLQRRSAPRFAVRGAVCRVPMADGVGYETLKVLDLGAGGIAVFACPEGFEPIVGAEVGACRLNLPGVGGVELALRVRHVGSLANVEGLRYCGCEFVRLSPVVRAILERYVED